METEAFYGKTSCKLFHPNLWSGPQWKLYIIGKKFVSIHYILAILTLEDTGSIKLNENKISTKNLKKKFTWNNLKDSHNNVWKLDKSLYGSNNFKEHGTKKLNAFREIMDLWQVKHILMFMCHKREVSSFSLSFTSYLDVQWLFKEEVLLKVWNKRFWIITFLLRHESWKGIKSSAMSFTSTKSNASMIY
jgi:hypothetical protein